ncbi:hypothetical protein J6590_108668 [Homalodisca vitripennis]|nr:hypothetical protein J6590_108337 [Homalodisca vitripennis]KAG8291836.1 hypothetical protein J6590_108668 [Homalodisca vitripennis]
MEQKDIVELTKQAKRSGSEDFMKYCKLKTKDYKTKLVNAKKTFYDRQIRNSDNISKKTWQIINKEIGKSSNVLKGSINCIKNDNDVIISDPLSISNCFNNYFIDVIGDLIQNTAKEPQSASHSGANVLDQNLIQNPFRCNPVDEKELDRIISSLKNKSSSGHDEVPLKLIKYVGKSLLKPLVHLINSSLITGNFPEVLKVSRVIPIFKKGEKFKMNNYRPVSVLPSLSKIYERVMYSRLVDHLKNNDLFDRQQHGFRKGKSITSALLEFTETIIDSIDKGDKSIGVFMDLSKAFDSISHQVLLDKLKVMGLSNLSLNWFRSYLSDRSQYVEITSKQNTLVVKHKSSTLKIKHGVPQGSILGPLLFLCYIQGMPSILNNINGTKSNLILYADDSNLIVTAKTYENLEIACKEQLKTIQTYFQRNSLFLNGCKTNQMIFSTVQSKDILEIPISVKQTKIEKINSIKFLGLNVDNNLSWDGHIKYLASKISSGLYILRRMSLLCSTETLKSIYYAHVHSHLAYGLAIYGGTSKKNLDTILILQKKALRTILNLEERISVKEKFSTLEIPTIYDQYILECIMCVGSNLDKLDTRSNIHSYHTRHRNNLDLPQHKLSFYKKKATYMGIKFLNHLPTNIKSKIYEKGFRCFFKEIFAATPLLLIGRVFFLNPNKIFIFEMLFGKIIGLSIILTQKCHFLFI